MAPKELITALALIMTASLAIVAYDSITTSSSVVLVRGAGATFPLPQILEWIKLYCSTHSGVVITYLGVGSGAGQAGFLEGVTNFCGSDPPLTHKQWLRLRGRVLQVPYLVGAVVVTYNLPGVGDVTLNLTGEVLAMIYSGIIKFWDDPRIQSLNPGVKLPHKRIVPVYRADASGTQYIFTLFLLKSAPKYWRPSWVSKVAKFPAAAEGFGRGGKGNPGVAQIILSTPYSIGFVEWGYAIEKGMPVAAIMNKCGVFVKPSIKSLEEAARSAAKELPKTPLGDFSSDLNLIVYAGGRDSYPITCWTHLILWRHYSECGIASALSSFLKWIARNGYKHLLPGYAPIPGSVKSLLIKAAEELNACSGEGGL